MTYPIALVLEKLCDAFDESVQRMIVPLLGIIYAERYITVGSLDLSQCNESIQSTLLDSLTVSFNHCSLFSFRHSKRITIHLSFLYAFFFFPLQRSSINFFSICEAYSCPTLLTNAQSETRLYQGAHFALMKLMISRDSFWGYGESLTMAHTPRSLQLPNIS